MNAPFSRRAPEQELRRRRVGVKMTGMSAFSHTPRAPATASLITEHVHATSADTLLFMNCGFIIGALDARAYSSAYAVWSTDRHMEAYAAAHAALANASAAPASETERRDHRTALAGHGTYALPGPLRSDPPAVSIVVIRIPREKAAAMQLIADAFGILRPGGRCYIAGATTEGIKSAARLMHELFGNSDVLGRQSSHRIVVASKRSAVPADASSFTDPLLDSDAFREVPVTLRGYSFVMYTRPGVFSWEHLDEATALLADVMQIGAGESVLDLGCGAGPLGIVAAKLSDGGPIVMVDADVEAVRCAALTAKNAGAVNVEVLPSDVASALHHRRFDVVLTNPPFHTGTATDLDLPRRFIGDAWSVLKPGGRMFLVANRTLPYEAEIIARFGSADIAGENNRFKVLTATRKS
jgi:16S rRNA (guanine1207-N2)-methyltransferase